MYLSKVSDKRCFLFAALMSKMPLDYQEMKKCKHQVFLRLKQHMVSNIEAIDTKMKHPSFQTSENSNQRLRS